MFPMYNYCPYFIYGLTCNYLLVSIKCQVDSSLRPKMHWCAIHHINSNTATLACGIILTKGHPTGADHQEERYHGSSSIDPTVYRRQINPTLDLWAAILNAVIYPCLSASLRNGGFFHEAIDTWRCSTLLNIFYVTSSMAERKSTSPLDRFWTMSFILRYIYGAIFRFAGNTLHSGKMIKLTKYFREVIYSLHVMQSC